MNDNRYTCPVCGKHSFEIMGTNQICPVCDWINDSVQCVYPNSRCGENKLTLNEYRERWKKIKENKKA